MKRSISAAMLILFTLAGNLAAAQEKRLKEDITCEQALELIQKHEKDASFVILDVRTPDEFNAGHLMNAENINFRAEDFKQQLEKLDKTRTYLIYCRKGGRSASAIGMMNDLKFTSVFHLYEGYDLWKSKGNATTN